MGDAPIFFSVRRSAVRADRWGVCRLWSGKLRSQFYATL
jgi:hypothetical protein